jgi:hypothetical protein
MGIWEGSNIVPDIMKKNPFPLVGIDPGSLGFPI